MKTLKTPLAAALMVAFLAAGVFAASEQDIDSAFSGIKFGETDDANASFDKQVLPITAGPLKIGGFVRANYAYKSWAKDYEHGGELALDTIGVNVNLQGTDPIIGSFQYRYYRTHHADPGHFYHFLHHGWLGYKFDDTKQIQVGVHQVPFGILPYASHNWFFQLPYYVGLEDDYDLGVKWVQDMGNTNLQLAYYYGDEGSYYGDSRDSSRYSYDVVENDTPQGANTERNQVNMRLAQTLDHGDGDKTELGLSLQYSQLHNNETGGDGDHYAIGTHLDGYYGKWNAKLEAIRYGYDAENPAGVSDDYVVMGAYDFPYQVAADGTMLVAGISRDLDVNFGPIKTVTVYNDYSVLLKDKSDYNDSHQNVLGMSFSVGRFFTMVDLAMGKNQPWLDSSWTDGLSAAADDKGWHTRFNVNIGYYF
ncbi:hypothetical protein L21SP3_01082 [Sedimentisphaera cyanobacteriorum]|uniref:Phosphate-selective porin n=1 Tax=Sedimentisphaera cyanobacteriorum TaxID=1940790 RepID=A0A1Q2HP99_9BACT|nr:porin [Sedimentisphaera cyanobacteriorum]AQQ09279.1 hypothetical protein L21SP3_01082 [Sedimentisphaera cyanobacteriorum]